MARVPRGGSAHERRTGSCAPAASLVCGYSAHERERHTGLCALAAWRHMWARTSRHCHSSPRDNWPLQLLDHAKSTGSSKGPMFIKGLGTARNGAMGVHLVQGDLQVT